jgi:hypothetical protein
MRGMPGRESVPTAGSSGHNHQAEIVWCAEMQKLTSNIKGCQTILAGELQLQIENCTTVIGLGTVAIAEWQPCDIRH